MLGSARPQKFATTSQSQPLGMGKDYSRMAETKCSKMKIKDSAKNRCIFLGFCLFAAGMWYFAQKQYAAMFFVFVVSAIFSLFAALITDDFKSMENFTDYMLRYTADVPTGEVYLHKKYDRNCDCQPVVTFNQNDGWRHFVHQPINKNNEGN